eukprot:2900773-Lingulodinium_polyedra.AAC.1
MAFAITTTTRLGRQPFLVNHDAVDGLMPLDMRVSSSLRNHTTCELALRPAVAGRAKPASGILTPTPLPLSVMHAA